MSADYPQFVTQTAVPFQRQLFTGDLCQLAIYLLCWHSVRSGLMHLMKEMDQLLEDGSFIGHPVPPGNRS